MNKYQKTTSTFSGDKKLQLSSHPLKAIQANTTTTTLPHNVKSKQEPKCFEITKTLKENVDTTTTVSSKTSSNLKSKGNNNFIVIYIEGKCSSWKESFFLFSFRPK
jgi:hypothetical protein